MKESKDRLVITSNNPTIHHIITEVIYRIFTDIIEEGEIFNVGQEQIDKKLDKSIEFKFNYISLNDLNVENWKKCIFQEKY